MKVIIAEKPSVARQIAAVVGANTRRDGYLEGEGYQITWALGHLAALKEPDEYDPQLKRWSLESLPIIPDKFQLKAQGDAGAQKQLRTIKHLVPRADELICATDAGREGELIFRYILQIVQGTKKKPVCKNITRLWLSSLTDSSIQRALQKRREIREYDNLYAAARCRSEADWIVGMNATRYYTVRYGEGGVLWSVGRVQTPVLALIARRNEEIVHFKPEPWFELKTSYRSAIFKRRAGKFKTSDEANRCLEAVQGRPFAVEKVSAKQKNLSPPQLYDLTTLQRDMNARYGISAADTLKHTQALYEGKAVTYPRTDSRYLTKDMHSEVRRSLEKLRSSRAQDIERLNLEKLSTSTRIFNDSRVNDHHAIIATGTLPSSTQRGSAPTRIYEAIVTRMIAAFYPPCLKEVTTVEGKVATVAFTVHGVVIKTPGWTSLYPKRKKTPTASEPNDDEPTDGQELPAFQVGEHGPHVPFVREGKTKPPKYHTEASLLGMMETAGKLVDDDTLKEALKERGLGTPATRAAIIETLLRRKYIERQAKEIHITPLGTYLVALISDPNLKSAELTGEWEAKLKTIERGAFSATDFMQQVSAFTHELVAPQPAALMPEAPPGRCPRCGADTIEGKRGFGCSKWKEGCKFVLWKSYRGHDLSQQDVSELLHWGRTTSLVRLSDSEQTLLYLNEAGQMGHISPPQNNPQRANGPPPTRSAAAQNGRPKKQSLSSDKLFDCPLCQEPVVENPRSFGCSGYKVGCPFVVWKTIAGKKISQHMAIKIGSGKKTQLLKGFKSKAGKKFDAHLVLEGGRVSFIFDQ